MQKLFILLLYFITAAAAFAQTAANSHVQQYTTDNGLPSNGIKGMQWDEKTGFLWMATEAGIVRFNGVDFKSYTKENMPSIASERMLFIARNHAGKIYTADQPGNIFFINKNKPVLWRPTTVKGSYNPYLRNYYLLAVSDTFFYKRIDSIPTALFSNGGDKIAPLNDTSCFILNNGNLFYHSISFKKAQLLPFEKGTVNNFFKIGNICFITSNKKNIFLLNPNNFSVTPVFFAAAGLDILKTKNNNNLLYWQNGMNSTVFIDEEKAWLLTYDGKAINATLIFTGIPADSYIKSVQYSEKNRLLFIGTESKGLIVINQNRVQSKKRNDINSKNRNSYYSQIELSDGNILTNESDIIGENITEKAKLPIQGKFSFNITHTGKDLLWFTQSNTEVGYTCLHQYNKSTGQTKVFPKIKWGDIIATSGKEIYLANPNGIGILKADSLFYLYNYPKSLAGTIVFDFTEINPGILAIATCAGLFRFNTNNNKFDTLFTKENICVRSIWKYKDYVFFGTYGSGYYICKDGEIKSMPLDKNKYLLYTHCFVPDNSGYCWISTNRGLFKASLSEITNAFEKNIPVVYYHYFGKKDGMEMTELNGGCTPCALRLSNNNISFPTMDGLLWVNPEKAIPVLPEGEIFIDEIRVDNIAVNADSMQYKSLPAQTQEILIELGFSAWCNKENIYLDYQLNDSITWKAVNTDNETFIRLGGLRSGKYTLRIRKLNGFGKDNYSYKTIQFSITTPWYMQWWFYALISAVILGIFIIIYRVRVNQLEINQLKLEKQVTEKTEELLQKNNTLEKNNSINNRLISIISHDIITPLKFLNVAGKNLLEKKSVMPEELKDETIKEITNTSKELQLLSTNILNWIKYQNENRRLVKEQFYLQEMLNQIFGILNSMAHQKNLKLISHVDEALSVTQYFEALKILIYNLVTNAIHFSDNGSITVNARETEKKIIISVSDEGVGMTADQIKNIMADQFIVSSANMDNKKGNGLGYLIIKDLLKMMNAQLSINSEKARPDDPFGRGKGTTVYVELPK
jgi:signal transduction histidine kinase